MTSVPVKQGSRAWLDYRRTVITATDLPVLLGLSPWRCEADLADEKLYGTAVEPNLRMRVGSALEPLIAEEYERATGRRVRRVRGMMRHRDIEWAAASPDATVIGERRLVEFKRSTSRTRFADGIPQDVEAQVAWQLGVSGYPAADIAVLLGDDDLVITEQAADPALFDNLVAVAADFRRRLGEGGPFARSEERIRHDHPADDGSEIVADNDTAEAVRALLAVRASIARMEEDEQRLKAAIEARMGEAAIMVGPGFRVSWKRTKDSEQTDWRSIATGLLTTLPETERATLVGLHTTVRPGFRPLRVTEEKE
jgi:putative phage-type endonuclease